MTHSFEAGRTLARLRALLLAVLAVGTLGTGVELLLLEHTEDAWQLVPLVLLGAGLVIMGWHTLGPGRTSLRALQGLMLLFVASGVAGILLHYRGNAEFELEMMAGLRGWDLFREAMSGATPALAPGTMIQLGLLGLAYGFRHPARRRPDPDPRIEESLP